MSESESVSWWSWRPGVKPGRAFLYGSLLALFALFLLANGIATLIGGILDNTSAPVRVHGIVTTHGLAIPGTPELTIRLDEPGLPPSITVITSPATSKALTNGTAVLVDYGPHLHIPYALESEGHHYTLPGTSTSGNLIETFSLLLSGLLLLPYPLLVSFWGWRDLHAVQRRQFTASVIALRAVRLTSTRTPGLVSRRTGTWHGVALKVDNTGNPLSKPEILIFRIREDLYSQLNLGDTIQGSCSLHLRYLSTLKQLKSK